MRFELRALSLQPWLVCLLLCGISSTARAERVETRVSALYGQGFDFWSKVKAVTQGSPSTTDLLGLLDSSFDHPEEGLASLGIHYEGPVKGTWLGALVDRGGFGVGVDGLAGGVAHNRILPDIDAYEAYAGHLDFGLRRDLGTLSSGWELGVGSTVGAGQQERVRGSAVELIDGMTPNISSLFYSGFDFEAGYRDQLGEAFSTRYRVLVQPTLLHSDFTSSGSQYAISVDQVTVRWRQESEWTLTLDTPFVPDFDLGLMAISGQQPTPVVFLPRIWDGIHSLSVFPSAGQLVGLGARAAVLDPRGRMGLTLDGGFYGGYFGASALLHLYAIELAAGTYGIEQSAGYRVDGSRIEFVSLGGSFAL